MNSNCLLQVQVGNVGDWSSHFQAMNSLSTLQAGYYGNLSRWPFHNPALGGLDGSGQGRGCNTRSGWFVVDAVSYVGTSLASIDLRFEQHCEGMAPALHGQLHWLAGAGSLARPALLKRGPLVAAGAGS